MPDVPEDADPELRVNTASSEDATAATGAAKPPPGQRLTARFRNLSATAKQLLAVGLAVAVVLSTFAILNFVVPRVPTGADRDGDGCTNEQELLWGFDPDNPADVLADHDEDGLPSFTECEMGTIPIDPDTDGDRLKDGEEVAGVETLQGTFVTDPLDPDVDDDGVVDGAEVLDFHRYDRIETEDHFRAVNATTFYSYVVQRVAGVGFSEISLNLTIPWTGEFKVVVGGTGSVTFESLRLNASTFTLDDLSSELIVNAPLVAIRGTGEAAALTPLRENRTWAHLYTDTQGTEEGIRVEQMDFKAQVGVFWVYAGDFLFTETGTYNLTLRIELPVDAARFDPLLRPHLTHLTSLQIETGFFRIWRRTLDPLNPDVDGDTLLDGTETAERMYPLNADPDEDGLSDPVERQLGTDDESRDTDLDGLRDPVELGRDGSATDPLTPWDTHLANADGDAGLTTTDPLDTDTDGDGLPDGVVDGWRFDEKRGWGRFGSADGVRQAWEGEDWDGDGLVDGGAWNQGQGPGETDPSNPDTDGDQLPEAWEVWHLLDPTRAVGEDGAAGNPDHDAAVREHSLVRQSTTGMLWPYGRAQTFVATETAYDNLLIWAENSPGNPFAEALDVYLLGTTNGRPDPAVSQQLVASVTVPVGTGELNISLQNHALTPGASYALWFRQASTTPTGVLLLGLGTEGAEGTGELWSEVSQVFEPLGDGNWDLYFSLLRWSGPDELTNLGEFVAGTNPRDPDTDGDGAPDWPEASVMYRTNVPQGGVSIDAYGSLAASGDYEWIWFNGLEYGFEERVEDPVVGHPGAAAANALVALLQPPHRSRFDAASIVVSPGGDHLYLWTSAPETTWYRTFYLWERTGRTYQWSSFADRNGNGRLDATLFVYALNASQGQADTSPTPQLAFKAQEIYLSDPFQPRSDWDRFPDRAEPLWFQDVDGDGLANARDTDSDGDGVGDDNEARFYWQPPDFVPLPDVDGDGLDNLVDPDSDGDGVEDGLEYLFYMDYDWDGYRNMVDPDADNDGLPDGWMDGFRYDNASAQLVFDPFYADGMAQPWEGEDFNGNGVFEPTLGETDPTNPDSDLDGLWDGFNLAVPRGRYEGFHVGELEIGTDPLRNDTEGDGVPDGAEVLGWSSGFWIPPRKLTSSPFLTDTDGDGLSDFLEFSSRMTDPSSIDSDGDGLEDGTEDADRDGVVDPGETRPWQHDSDNDGLNDGLEVGLSMWDVNTSTTTDPLDPDTDGDGLRDGIEDANRDGAVDPGEADPNDPDSDDDGIQDGPEYRILGNGDRDGDGTPNLRDPDSDGDCIPDGDDLWRNDTGTQVRAWFLDFDGDGLVNALDVDSDGDLSNDTDEDSGIVGKACNGRYDGSPEFDPLSGDQDNDGALDGREDQVFVDRTNPDTDGDGILDGYEQDWYLNSDGTGGVNANDTDSDDDGLTDDLEDLDLDGVFEPLGGDAGNETNPTSGDTDLDALTDYEERLYGTDPWTNDTDGDGVLDGDEIHVYGSNATNPYTDGDAYSDGEEVRGDWGYPTSPTSSDTDGDGLYDHEEVRLGYNPLIPDMDGDGLVDGDDLQPLAWWPDMYAAPAEERRTIEFVGAEFEELVSYGAAADLGTAELANVLDHPRLIAPEMPVAAFAGSAIGTNTFQEDLLPYSEGFGEGVPIGTDLAVLRFADSIFQDVGYQVKFTPGIWERGPWNYVDTVGTTDFRRANFTVTFDNYRPVPAPGGFYHRLFEWEFAPDSTNAISVQFGLDPAYDESFETNGSWKLPGLGIRVYRYSEGTLFEEVFSSVVPGTFLGEHHYQVDLRVPPVPSSALRFPSETHVVDLILVWITATNTTGVSLEPLMPYRYRDAVIERMEIAATDHEAAYGPERFGNTEIISAVLESLNLTWDDLLLANAVLEVLGRTFAALAEEASIAEDAAALAPQLNWMAVRTFAQGIASAGIAMEDLLEMLTESHRYGVEDVVVRATIRGYNPIQILTVSSVTTVTRNETRVILPKEHVPVEEAISDFEGLGLDLVAAPSGGYNAGSRSLFFYNARTADATDLLTLRDMAENGTGADVLVISSASRGDYQRLMQDLNWSGVWSAIVDDGNRSAGYQGNSSESANEVHGGVRQIRPFGARSGATYYNSTTQSFYYDPGEFLSATANATALPGAALSEGFTFRRLPPPPERWVFHNLSAPGLPAFESDQTTFTGRSETVENLREDVLLEFQAFRYNRIIKKSVLKGDVVPSGFSAVRIRGLQAALGVAGVFIVWDTWGDAVVAYREGRYVYMALLVVDGLIDVAEISYAIFEMSKLTRLSEVLGIATVVVGILFSAYLITQAFRAETPLETEFFLIQGLIVLGETAVLLIPGAWVVQLVTLGVTYILSKFGILPGPMGIVELFTTLYYWSHGCTSPGERADRLEEVQGYLEEISSWLDQTLNAHADRGELAFFVGGLSLVEEARDLADGKC